MAQPTCRIAFDLLIEFVEFKKTESLELEDILAILEQREFGIGIEATTYLHEQTPLDLDGVVWHYQEEED
jgi:hypothetical protein